VPADHHRAGGRCGCCGGPVGGRLARARPRTTQLLGISTHRDYIEGRHLQLGYAGTVHTHQGQTVERTVVAARADEMYAELAYVSASRARDTTDVYVIAEDGRDSARAEMGPLSQERARDERDELIRTMKESRGEQLAIEQLPERDPRQRLLRRDHVRFSAPARPTDISHIG
jgi:hypothetical protein